jgi:mannosyltransferase OCH1-like enzyme
MATNESAMLPSNKIIQGLWIGPELSVMEQLSIASFLAHGHNYHLYIYDDVKNIPAGTTLKDGNEILPSTDIFQYTGRPSYAGFSNFFRYKLLLERGGWWADTDVVCLKPFDFEDDYVFSSEISKGMEVVNSGLIKAPVGSEVMGWAWEVCKTKKPELLVWGETGPKLLAEAVRKFSLDEYAKPPQVFCPLAFFEWEKVLEPQQLLTAGGLTYAIHLWNDKWRDAGRDKNAQYPKHCLYEELKRQYLRSG